MERTVTEHIIHERVRVERPLGRDVVIIYKVRHVRRHIYEGDALTGVEYVGYYGGIDGTWNQFEPYAPLDYEAPGCISMDGRNWLMLRDGIREMEERERGQLESILQDLVTMFRADACRTD